MDQELARQALEVTLVQQLAAELREIAALAELGAVLEPFERGADPLSRRHQQAADDEHRGDRQQVAQQAARRRHPVLDQHAQDREAGETEEDG